MIFEFESEDGKRIERDFRIGTCPESITEEGITYLRAYSLPTVIMEPGRAKYIGDLADKNTKQREKDGLAPKAALPEPHHMGEDPKKIMKKLDGKSPKQLENYIRTGEL